MDLEKYLNLVRAWYRDVSASIRRRLSKSDSEESLAGLLLIASIAVASIILVAVTILVATGISNAFVDGANAFDYMGPFGDFVGGILNPILTFLMFIGVLVTILIQSKELKETRDEIKRQSAFHQEHIKILKSEEKRRQLESAFNDAKSQYWSIAKEKIYHNNSLFDLIMNEEKMPDTRYVRMQLTLLERKQEAITLLATRLLPNLAKPVQQVIIGDIEDYYKFSIVAKILTQEKMDENMKKIDDAVSVEPLGTTLLKGLIKWFSDSTGDKDGEKT